MTEKSEAGFLNRWSSRKRDTAGSTSVSGPIEAPETDALSPEPAPEKTDDEVLAELGLPAPESLDSGDDFSQFMAKAVPTRLRNRALRRLWLSNPALANLDELVDYGDDFTDAATVVENMQTAYQAGRGFLKDVVEDDGHADASEESDAATPESEAADAEDFPTGENTPPPEAGSDVAFQAADMAQDIPEVGKTAPEALEMAEFPRRMRFRIQQS